MIYNQIYLPQTWGGGSDSYFEYLLKYARLSGTSDPIFIDTWREAVDSSIKVLLKVCLQTFLRSNENIH